MGPEGGVPKAATAFSDEWCSESMKSGLRIVRHGPDIDEYRVEAVANISRISLSALLASLLLAYFVVVCNLGRMSLGPGLNAFFFPIPEPMD